MRTAIHVVWKLPPSEIGGLRFIRQEVRTTFELQGDGFYHSRDVLFLSARNTAKDTSRDVLSEYLNLPAVTASFYDALQAATHTDLSARQIVFALPRENEGVKRYYGVPCWYWLSDKLARYAGYYQVADMKGNYNHGVANVVCGCAPMFTFADGE
ncbi:MAG: hypothetical protein LBN30_06800 [Oscillospiraceae bacterium]|jgi:hypothetical protein|nr:hypothetical protein [Oscillospiraceae bacterium]